jgi:hypothetical protein
VTGIDLNCHDLVSFTNIMTSFLRDSMVAGVIVVLYYKLTKNRLNMQVQARQRQNCMEAPDSRNGSLGGGCSVNTEDVQ